ncbi:MAG TPA: PH domain-containing protein [Beijerinckiaceae bacterium]|nr:PH domain-containing protein [Beijerinckiaceae bacterium]
MSYVNEVLQPDETVRFRTNVHWSVYLKAITALVIGLALLAWYWRDGTGSMVLLLAAAAFGVSALILVVPPFLERLGTEIAITDRRIIYKTGLVQRHTVEISMDKVESVDVDQSVLGRIFGYGTVTVRGTGEAAEPLRNVAAPIALRNAVLVP